MSVCGQVPTFQLFSDIYRVRFWLKKQCFILCLTLQQFKVTIPLIICTVESTKIVHQVLRMQSRSNYGSNKWYIIGHQWIFIFNSRSGTSSLCKNPSSTPSLVTSQQVTVRAENDLKHHLVAGC